MFPLLLLTGCATPPAQPVEYRTVRLPQLSLPAELTGPVDAPVPPANLTWGDTLSLNAELYGLLGRCNADRAAIRSVEAAQRQVSTDN
ncbi:peptidase [Pantoea rodasii]|uniref:Rz1-like lysis system protein LysC n=1 Tax=Pantoea rodasii TaxID=1076549 RepID=UPI000FFC46F1